MGSEQFLNLLKQTDEAVKVGTISELVEEFLVCCVQEEIAIDTITTRRSHLMRFARFCASLGVADIELLNNVFIEQYFVQYRETHKLSTTHTSKRIMKVFLAWVREYKEVNIRAVPETIKTKKDKYTKRKHLDREIIEKVISECTNEQDQLIIAVFAEAGMRVSELTRLKTSDIRWDEIDVHGKGSVDRSVHITDELAVKLRRFILDKKRQPDEYLFQNTRAGIKPKLTTSTVRWHVRKWFKRVVDKDVTPHHLRHSFAIMLLLGGTSLVTIQKLLGHEDINTTMIYLRIADPEAKIDYKTHIGKSLTA